MKKYRVVKTEVGHGGTVNVVPKHWIWLVLMVCLGMDVSAQQTTPSDSFQVTFIINDYPENTPHDATIYLAGEFDGWFPDVSENKLTKFADGTYRLTKSFSQNHFTYKFTRGSWKAVEGRGHGRSRPNRHYIRSEDGNTVYIKIRSWEDITSSTFNSYVYILLFAALQSFLMIFAIYAIRNKNRKANAYLTFQLILIGIALIGRASIYQSDIFNWQPKVLLLPDIILFTYAPSFYIYIHHLLKIPLKWGKYWYLHFIPAIVHVILYIPYLTMANQTLIYRIIDMDLFPVFAASGTVALIYNTIYWFMAYRTVRKGAREEKQNKDYQKYIGFLKIVLWIMLGYLGIWAFATLMYVVGEWFNIYTTDVMDTALDLLWLLFSVIVFYLGYHAIRQPELLRLKVEEKKYKDSLLSDEEFDKVKSTLERLMSVDRVYLNPDLTLPELSNKIPTSVHTLSRVINEGFDQTFSQFINENRVKEFISRMENGEKPESYLSLAFAVGFNSKATFNRSFKKYTGTTPRLYFKDESINE